jgi:hypothetical protein
MAKQWVVLFDTLGVDTLLPWDDLKREDMMLTVLSGKKPKDRVGQRVSLMVIQAQANHQRFPEVWAYDTAEDYEYENMRKMWEDAPQPVADMVRAKGTNLFRHTKEKSVII